MIYVHSKYMVVDDEVCSSHLPFLASGGASVRAQSVIC